MRRRSFVGGLAATAAFATMLRPAAEHALAAAPSWDAIEKAAKKEGTVTVYHNFFPTGVRSIFAAFNKQYPDIQVRAIRLASSQFYQRFAAEHAAGRVTADISVNSMDDIILGWRKRNWIARWNPPEAVAIPAAMSIQSSIWGVQAIRHIFAYNKAAVPAAEAPKEWLDLFNPMWKGQIGMDEPWRSVGPLLCMQFLEKTFKIDTAKKFKAQDVRFFAGSAGVVQALIRGDIKVGQVADFVLTQPLEDGAPIAPVYPKSGVAYVTNVAFVSEGASHPNAGRVLANWFMSKAGQEALQNYSGSSGVRDDIPPPKVLPANKSLHLVDGRSLLTRQDADRLTAEWRKVFNVT